MDGWGLLGLLLTGWWYHEIPNIWKNHKNPWFQTTKQFIIQWVYPLYPMGLSPITIWLFNSSPWKITMLLIGKTSISMGYAMAM